MSEKSNEKPKLELVDPTLSAEDEAALDQDELEYRRLRRDLPGVPERAAQGIVAIAVSKIPTKNEFFRTHATFRPDRQAGQRRSRHGATVLRRRPRHGACRCTASASAVRNTHSI